MDSKQLIELGATFERAQRWQQAADVYDLLLEHEPGHLEALARRAAMACQQGDPEAAAATLVRLAERSPDAAPVQKMVGQALIALGRGEQAAERLRRALTLAPDPELFQSLLQVAMPGPTYYAHLQRLHECLKPRAYLEIGIWHGDTLGLARPPTRAYGVDPEPRVAASGFAAETRIYPLTSDAFFASRPWRDGGGPTAFDLVFIDGLHLFEQVLTDFINVERHAAPGGVVVFHDTLPLVAAAAERAATVPFWSGDVWKIVPCLERYRPDLVITTLPTSPSGLSIVRGLDPTSTVLADRRDAVLAEMAALPYAALENRLPELLRRHPNSLDETVRAARGVAASGAAASGA